MDSQASRNPPPLFESLPELKGKIRWLLLGSFPTPVQRLTNLGLKNLWIKRDDLSSPIYGGNKIRKLGFILPDLIQKNKTRLVTLGGIGANHVLASAIFSQQMGIPCTLLLFNHR
jgi:D-cysteine desulfhydrase